jgi:3-oxoadipate enol-lactonase
LEVKGGRIAYDVAGQGRAVVLIHEAIADRRMWDRDFGRLSQGHRVVRFDARGFGESSKASGPFSPLDDVAALIDHLRLERPVLVGASMGGGIAIDYALAHPHGVSGLFLMAPGVSGMEFSMFPGGKEVFAEDERLSTAAQSAWREGRKDDAIEALRQLWGAALQGKALELFRTMARDNAEEIFTEVSGSQAQREGPGTALRLPEVHLPTVIIYGDRDNPASGPIAELVRKGIAGSRVIMIPGGDHMINLSQPEAFDAALTEFLRGLS